MNDPPIASMTPIAAQAGDLAARGATAVLTAAPESEPAWAKPAVSILSLLVFVVLIAVAWWTGDKTSLAILSGVGASLAQQVAGYWLGSSSGSARKTALLAAAPAIPLPPAG